jgi:hypothetical protein
MPNPFFDGSRAAWAFDEFCDVYEIQADFRKKVEAQFQKMLETAFCPVATK